MLFPSESVRANYAETGHVAQRSGRIEMPLTRRRPGGMPLWYIYKCQYLLWTPMEKANLDSPNSTALNGLINYSIVPICFL